MMMRRGSMEIVFTGKNFEVTEPLRAFAKEKLEKVLKLIRNVIEVHIFLSIEKHRHIAEIVIRAKASTFSGESETADMYSSLGMAVDKIENQVRRRVGKLIGRKRRRVPMENPEPLEEFDAEEEAEPSSEESGWAITKVDYEVKPMSVEEAAMQIEATGEHFIVFWNSSTERVNVLYKRKDGTLGLIDPQEK
jgi:putative sigma-54 modulation protein